MASARCESCGSPQGLKNSYRHGHDQISPTNKPILCGSPSCARFARIWLTDEEQQAYMQGVRVFRVSNHAVEARIG